MSRVRISSPALSYIGVGNEGKLNVVSAEPRNLVSRSELNWSRNRDKNSDTNVLNKPKSFEVLSNCFLNSSKNLLSRCSSGVEHFLGKEEVSGSIPDNGSSFFLIIKSGV